MNPVSAKLKHPPAPRKWTRTDRATNDNPHPSVLPLGSPPPWLADTQPENWVPIAVAAHAYFRKSVVAVRRYIDNGYLEKDGLLAYCDGTRWFIRLPYRVYKAPGRLHEGTFFPDPGYGKSYELSMAEKDGLEKLQQGRCAICGDERWSLIVDHDHKTNRVRGLLCNRCNTGLGMFCDSIDNLAKAIAYLKNTPFAQVVASQNHQSSQINRRSA